MYVLTPFRMVLISDGKFNLRSWNNWITLRSRSSRFRNGDISPYNLGSCNGLDYSPGRLERKTIRKRIIYGSDAPLFWSLGISGGLFLSIRIRFRRVSHLIVRRGERLICRMCAFSVIIGDTIPHVIAYLFPVLAEHAGLRLLVDRRVIIILCTLAVSFPLSLHRDIVKLSKSSGFGMSPTTPCTRIELILSTGLNVYHRRDGGPERSCSRTRTEGSTITCRLPYPLWGI
jgi:hypothetical protein